jgi:hypothetical protein
VRSVAHGNETVPTVFAGTHRHGQPCVGQVWAAVRDHAPDLAARVAPKASRWPVVSSTCAATAVHRARHQAARRLRQPAVAGGSRKLVLKNDVIVGPVNANLHQYDLAAAAFQPQPDGVKR